MDDIYSNNDFTRLDGCANIAGISSPLDKGRGRIVHDDEMIQCTYVQN